jgi:hypothetical protein
MLKHLLVAAVVAVTAAAAQDAPTVDKIVKKANHMAYYQGKDGRARVKMTVTDAQGRTRTRSSRTALAATSNSKFVGVT